MMKSAPALLAAALMLALPVAARASAPVPAGSVDPLDAYVHARAADDLGQLDVAAVSFARALAADPSSNMLAIQTYRQAIAAGDMALALRTADALDKARSLPPDGTLLLAADAVRRKDWKQADALCDRIVAEKLFGFVTPVMRAWIAYGRHRDPYAPLAGAAAVSKLAVPYAAEHRALLLIATRHDKEGIAAITALAGAESARGARLRIAGAAELARRHKKDEAMALLQGAEPSLARARALLAAGRDLPGAVDNPAEGVAELYARVAADLHHEETATLALAFARIGSYLAPEDSETWLLSAALLANRSDDQAALAALDHVGAGDPFIGAARDERVVLLRRDGRDDEALAVAEQAAHDPGAQATDWARLGDLLAQDDRYAEAADAYGRALALSGGDKAPREVAWPLMLQRANALLQSGDWPSARGLAEAALKLAPNQPELLNFLGYTEVERGENIPAAAAMIARASAFAPDDPAITDSLGWSWYVRGDVKKAIPLLERAAQGAPTQSDINEHLGDAYWAAGRRLEARYAWRRSLVVADPKDADRLKAKIDFGPKPRS